ncbi:MAG: spore cortex biosynthesis protein YabQ [Roseburia sp.]|nr:spore cortex biosynthesis protein YabQ [Roseburia sp.]
MSGGVSPAITQEGGLLLLSFGVGVLLMFSYDILRIFRQIIAHGTFSLGVEDVIYWLACSLVVFAMLYQENDGLLRWFVLAGIALGMMVENHFLSPFIVRFSSRVIKKALHLFGKIVKVALKPMGIAAGRGKKIYIFLKKQLKKIGKAIKIGVRKL